MSLNNILDEFKSNPYSGGDEELDDLLAEFRNKPQPQKTQQSEGLPILGNGVVGNLVGGAGSSFLRGFGDLAQFVGADSVGNTLNEGAQWIDDRLPEFRQAEASLDYVTDPSGLARATGNAVGSWLSILLPTALLPGGALKTGAQLFSKIPGVTAGMGKWATRGLLGGIPESGMEAGSFERNALANGMNPDEAAQKSWGVFGRNLPFLMASNAFQAGIVPKIVGKGTSLGSRVGGGLANLLTQGLEEGYQEGFQNEVSGKPYSYNPAQWSDPKYSEQLQAAKEGIAGFALPTALGVVGGSLSNRNSGKAKNPQPQPEPQPEPPRTIQDEYTDTKNRYNYENPTDDSALVSWARKISGEGNNEETIRKVIAEAKAQGVDPRLALALANAESNIGLNAENSGAGAIGVMQLMPETAKSLDVDPYNEDENIRGGIKYLKQMLEEFDGDTRLATAAYNAGPGAVQKYGGVPNYDETQNYVARIHGDLGSQPEYKGGDGTQERTGNVFGTENYDMPVAEMESTLEGLKPGWSDMLPQIGGVLKNRFGYSPIITSGARTSEHQMRINPDAPNSYHIIQDDGGDAVDIAFEDGELNEQQAQELKDYFKGTGLFDEVLYHAVEGGLHLHLGGLNTEKMNSMRQALPESSTSRAPSISIPQTESSESTNRKDEPEEEYQPIDFSDDDETTQNLFDEFLQSKKNSDDENLFANLLNQDEEFVNTKENRDEVQKIFGEEFDKFLQAKGYQTAPKVKTQEQIKPKQGKVEFEGIKPPPKKYLGSDLVSQAKLLSEYAQQQKDGVLWHKVDQAIKKRDETEMQKLVRDNPLPEDFSNSQQTEKISETSTQEKPKPKVEIPAKTLEIARAHVDEKNSDARKKQGEALLEIAKLNNFEVDKDLARLSAKGFKKFVPQLQAELQNAGLLGESNSQKISRLANEFDKHQTEMENFRRINQKVAEGDDISAKRKVWEDFEQLRQAQETRSQELADLYSSETQEGRRLASYRKVESDYQNEIDEVAEQMKTVREQGLKLDGEERKAKVKEFKALERQKKSLETEKNKFLESVEYNTKRLGEVRKQISDMLDFRDDGETLSKKETKKFNSLMTEMQGIEKKLYDLQEPRRQAKAETERKIEQYRAQAGQTAEQYREMYRNAEQQAKVKNIELPEYGDQAEQFESQHAKPAQQQNQNFDDVQQQIKQILGDIQAQEITPQKSETPPTSKKTYHFDGTENQPAKEKPAEEKPAEEKSVEEKTVEIKPAEIKPAKKKEKRTVEKIKAKADNFFKDFSDGKVNAAQTNEKLEKLANRTDDNQKLTDEEKADVRDYIYELKADLTDYSHGEKDLNVSENESAEEKPAETKKAANTGEQDTSKAELPQGYKTESGLNLNDAVSWDFILKPDGSKDFGEIDQNTAQVANENLQKNNSKSRMKAAPIRLQVGNENFGYIHLNQRHLSQMQDKGFDNAIDFINHTLKNFNQIYDQSHTHKKSGKLINRFVLYCKGDESKGFMPLDLELEKETEGYYTIVSANPHNENIKGELIFDDSSKSSSVAATDSLIEDSNNENGVVSPRANAKTNSPAENISQSENQSKEIDKEKTPEEKSESKIQSRPVGKTAKVIINDTIKDKLNTHYKVVEDSDLVASHFWDGNDNKKNPKYPEELQPRGRENPLSAAAVDKMARNLDPSRLEQGENVNQGASIVRNDGVILNGNGRFLAINRAYSKYQEKADEYKQYLVDNAEKFGLNPDEISQMKRPVLIREVEDSLDSDLTQEITGTTTGGTNFRQEESAKVDAKKITKFTLNHYIDSLNYGDLQYEIINDIAPEGDPRRVSFFSEIAAGRSALNDAGKNAADKALFALAYGNERLIAKMANGVQDVSANLKEALLKSAPFVAQANDLTANAGYNLGKTIADAVDAYVEVKAKSNNSGVDAWLEQNASSVLFDPVQKAKVDIVDFIRHHIGKKATPVRDFLTKIANSVIEQHSEENSFFALDEEMFNAQIDEIVANKKNEYGMESLFEVEGDPDVSITDDMIVAEKDLTSQQKTFVEIGNELGLPTKFFKGDPKFKGVLRKGTSYINVNNKNFEQTFWHETAHYLSNFNPEMFDEILKVVPITEKQLQAIRDKSPHYEKLSEMQLKEEILADNFMDFSKRAGLLREIGKQDKNLAERFISWLKTLMDKFASFFSNPKGGLTRTQREAMYDAFKKNVRAMVGGNGNKLFRVSNVTGEIQKFNGEKLPRMDLQMFGKNQVDRQGNLTDNQKQNLFDTIKNHIDSYISEQVKAGKNESDVAKELTAENSRHRAKTLGALQATLRDFENRAKDKEHRRLTVERIHGKQNWSDAEIDEKYKIDTDNLREMVDYGGVLYHEIALNRAGTQKDAGGSIQLLSWADAERQRDARETGTKSRINERHSEKRSAFFNGEDRYSIEPSNNSNESWKSKVANWFLGRPVERLNREITKLLRDVTDLKIHYRHFSGDAAVVLDELHGVLRAKNAYKWEEILPVIGGKIAEKLNLRPSEKMNNFIADWLLTGALNNVSTERTQFERAMREKPDLAEPLMEIQGKFRTYANMDTLEKYKAHIGGDSEGTLRKIIRAKQEGTLIDRIAEEIIDDLNPLKKIDERFEKLFGVKLAENETVYNAARMYKGAGGIVRNLLRAETDAEVKATIDALKKIYPSVNFEKFVPLQKIIANIGGAKYVEDLEGYCVACLDKEMHEKNRELEEKARAKGKTLEEKDKYKPVMSEEEADAVIRKHKNRLGQAQQDLVNFSNTILEISHESGLISDNQYKQMKENWKNYVPTHRIFDEADTIELADSMKHKRGSERDIVHPIRVIIRNTAFFVDQAEKNKVKQELAAKVRLGAFGDLISEEEFRNGNEPTIDFKENGKTKHLAVTPEIKRAVDSLSGDRTQTAYVFKVLHAASRIVSNMYTAASPDFAVGNIFRDAQESYLYNDKAKAFSLYNNPIANLIRAFKFLFNSFKKPPEYTETFYEWQAMGGSQASFVSFDMDSTRDTIDDITKTGKEKWISQPFTQILRSLQEFSERLETANRLAVYEQTKGILAKQNADGKATKSDMRRAAFASRNATIDFARGGRSMRQINKYFRFSNVAVQDLEKSVTLLKTLDPRNLKTKEGRQKAFDTAIKIGFLVLTTAVLFAKNHDEDWYKHGTQQWQKDTSWILGEGVKIPKSYSFVGKLTSTLTEEFLKGMVDNEPIKARRLLSPLGEALPSLMPTLLTPMIEAVSNYSFFYGGNLVPQKELRLPAHMQYNEKTGWFAKEIGGSAPARFLSEMLFGNAEGFSPRRIDHVINGYLGFPGKLFSGQYTSTLDESPMVKRFLFDPYKNPQIVQDYYNKRSEQERFFNEYKQNRKEGKNEKPDGYDEQLYRRIKSVEKVMKKISEKERKLIANQKIPANELKKQLRKLEEKRIQLCKRVFGYN